LQTSEVCAARDHPLSREIQAHRACLKGNRAVVKVIDGVTNDEFVFQLLDICDVVKM